MHVDFTTYHTTGRLLVGHCNMKVVGAVAEAQIRARAVAEVLEAAIARIRAHNSLALLLERGQGACRCW